MLPRVSLIKTILYSIAAALTAVFITIWFLNFSRIAYTGSMELDFSSTDTNCIKAFNITAYTLRGFPVQLSGIDKTYRLTEKFRSYSYLAVEIPDGGCAGNTILTVKYKGSRFIYHSSDITQWKKKLSGGGNKFILNPEISKLTGFNEKNLSLVYLLISSIYWSGLYKYLSIVMILLVIILLLLLLKEYLRKRREMPEPGDGKIKNSKLMIFTKWSLLSLLTITCIVHLLLIYFGIVISTTGPVLMTMFFTVLIFLSTFLLRKYPVLKKNLILFLIVIYTCLMLVEIFLRLSGMTSTYLEKRNGGFYQSPYKTQESGWYHVWPANTVHYLKTPEYNFIRNTNSMGLSDKELLLTKKEGEFRIIGLGDSFTEGDGADKDSSWMKFLERSLRKQYPGENLNFFNAGVCGSDPFFEYVLLRDKLVKYKPDIVIVAFNDEASDILVRGGMERFLPDGTTAYKKPPSWEPFYAYSHIFRLIIHKLLHYDHSFLKPGEYEKEKEKAIQVFITAIPLFRELSIRNNFKLIIIVHPNQGEIINHKFVYIERIAEACKNLNIECLDLLYYYNNIENIQKENSGSYFWKYDGHHNAKGYAAFARGVEWKLRQLGILDTIKIKQHEK